ncbi:glycosyl hydrolase family 28 protein [Jiella sp. MQZ9-1]|uniref:Glycoside hydrolase family 28 protein n=1 Tax=Jiella flava TaxID=2816857 RepID=A0A939JUM6_9HYPH|nr:glycosyl hydrolase family 28 protein [Jiella flava]MBO0661117.1 glycoside hydrolase family 28 protein [Jiella flava]MCD2469763.1 glycosyl hydrolase family 28 protein [Jiella flava]
MCPDPDLPRPDDIILQETAGDATDRIQAALDRARQVGCRLILGPGRYPTRGLVFRAGAHLHLSESAILEPVGDYEAYAETSVDVIAEDSDRAILVAKGAKDIRISGRGVIAAPSSDFVVGALADMGTHLPARLRPRVLVFDGCRNVRIEEISIRQSPMWTLHLVACTDVVVRNVAIENDPRMPNTDGIVIDSCVNVAIEHVDVATADDGVVVKTSRRTDGSPVGPCRNIRVHASRIESRSCALKIGTETHSECAEITFSDCSVVASNRALGIFSRDGGEIHNVAFRRIAVDCSETPDGFWGSGEAITVNVVDRRPERPAGAVRDVVFEDISGVMEGAINLVALGEADMSGIALRRINLQQRLGKLGTGSCCDLRPTRADLAPAKDATGRANAYVKNALGAVVGLVAYPDGMPGLFAFHVHDLVCDDVHIHRPDPLPTGWSRKRQIMTSKAFVSDIGSIVWPENGN